MQKAPKYRLVQVIETEHMSLLLQLEKAIQALEKQKQSLFESLENSCWQYERLLERIPEQVKQSLLDDDLFSQYTIPEQAPLPPNLHRAYQHWVSASRVLIAKNNPSRLDEFDELYELVKSALVNRHISKPDQFILQERIDRQSDLLSAIPNHLKYSLYDIELEAYSTIINDELQAAEHLLAKGFLRPAGSLAGVLLERHLKTLLRKHNPPIKVRKNATLSPLNDACKDNVYDSVAWRKVQHLTDLRNICAHDKTKDPTKLQVTELIAGVSSILKMYSPQRNSEGIKLESYGSSETLV